MEEKKEKFKFLKNISGKFKELDPKRKKLILIVSIIVLVLVIISIITSIIFSSLIGSAGKVAGNLNNLGFVTQKGSKVYLSNSMANDEKDSKKGLYEVTSDNKVKLVEEGEWIKSINYYKGYLYFLSINAIDDTSGNYERQVVKMKPNGEKRTVLVNGIETTSVENDSLNVSDGWIYYLNADKKLEKIKTNGEKRQQISDDNIKRFQISGKYIYYTSEDDEFCKMKKDGSKREQIETGIDEFQVVGNDIYYTRSTDNHLMRFNMTKDKNQEEEIVSKSVIAFNIYEKTVYYAVNEIDSNGNSLEKAIYKVNTNGKKGAKVVDLYGSNVYMCIAGDWIYYIDKSSEDSQYYYEIYRINKNGENKERVNI